MKIQIISTTDNKRVGNIYEVENVDIETVSSLGMIPDYIIWKDEICYITNSCKRWLLFKLFFHRCLRGWGMI